MRTFKQQTYYVIDSSDFDLLIQAELGVGYNSVAANEWSNDTSYTAHITKQGYDHYSKQSVQDFIIGKGLREMKTDLWICILEHLAVKEVIPEGHYLITVCW